MAKIVKTRILIISDTHCASLGRQGEETLPASSPFQAPLPPADLLIHCGDLTNTGQLDEYHEALDVLREIDALVKLVIAGNHDLSLDKDFLSRHLGVRSKDDAKLAATQARDLWTAPSGRAKTEGVTFLDEGIHNVDLPNGACVKVYASPYTPEFCDWGFSYASDEDRFNQPEATLSDAKSIAVTPMPSVSCSQRPIDICITHGPPFARLDKVERGTNVGCPHLLRALMQARPLVHCFGHIHEGWGAERIRWSTNADDVICPPTSTAEWRNGGWQAGIKSMKKVETDLHAARYQHGVFHDVSTTESKALVRGEESLLVNAAIMDVNYDPINAPWIIDMNLPSTPGT